MCTTNSRERNCQWELSQRQWSISRHVLCQRRKQYFSRHTHLASEGKSPQIDSRMRNVLQTRPRYLGDIPGKDLLTTVQNSKSTS